MKIVLLNSLFVLLLPKVCGVWLLIAQKPIKGQAGGKESLLYFRCWQLHNWVGAGWQTFIQRLIPPPQGAACRNSTALMVIFKLVISSLMNIILTILGTVHFQFQGPFVPISLRPVLRIVAAHVLGTVWSSCI